MFSARLIYGPPCRAPLSTSPLTQSARFQVTSIIDPDNQDTVTNCADAVYKPDRLRIRVMGMGPGNSQKNMEIVVDRYTLDYPVNAVVTLPNGSGNPMAFALGDSNVTTTSGVDASRYRRYTSGIRGQ